MVINMLTLFIYLDFSKVFDEIPIKRPLKYPLKKEEDGSGDGSKEDDEGWNEDGEQIFKLVCRIRLLWEN